MENRRPLLAQMIHFGSLGEPTSERSRKIASGCCRRPSLGMGIMGYQWLTSESNGAPMENHGKPANYHWKSLIARLYLRRWVRSQGRAILRLMVIDVDSPEAIWEGITFPHLFYLSFGKNFPQQSLPFCKCFAHPFGLCLHRASTYE